MAMKTLKFRVAGQRLYKSASLYDYYIVQGSENFLALSFTFSPEWEGVQKVVSFNDGADYQAIQDSACIVPAEILAGNTFSFSLIGISGDQKIVTNSVTMTQKEG